MEHREVLLGGLESCQMPVANLTLKKGSEEERRRFIPLDRA